MAKRKIPNDTIFFHYYNANPKDKRTTDCVYRALSVAMDKTWKDVMMEMTEMACKYGYVPSDITLINKYLKKNGWVKRKQPRMYDGRRLTGCQWLTTVGKETMIINIGSGHMSCIKDGKIWDTWDCSGRCVGNYWVKE